MNEAKTLIVTGGGGKVVLSPEGHTSDGVQLFDLIIVEGLLTAAELCALARAIQQTLGGDVTTIEVADALRRKK